MLMGILNVLFLELILCIVLVLQQIEACNLIQSLLLVSFYSKKKILEGCHEMLNCYVFNFCALFLKLYLFEAVLFYLNLH